MCAPFGRPTIGGTRLRPGYGRGVPVRLGANGIEEIIEIELTEEEHNELAASADAVRQVVDVLNLEVAIGA